MNLPEDRLRLGKSPAFGSAPEDVAPRDRDGALLSKLQRVLTEGARLTDSERDRAIARLLLGD